MAYRGIHGGPSSARIVFVVLLLASVLVWVRPDPAPADVVDPFHPVYAVNDQGSVILRGNANLTCDTAASGNCADAKSGALSGGILNNNAYKMVDVDIDGDGTTFNSSSADLTIPSGAVVLFAGLFWSADTDPGTGTPAPDPTSRDTVRFKVPGGAYRTITASRFSTVTSFSGHSPYQGYADVSALVAGAGSGTYTVADIQAATATNDRYAAWSLALVVHDPADPVRNLVVYDGFGAVRAITPADATVTIPVTGFQTPTTGAVTTRLGTVAYEGDRGSPGDRLKLNGTAMHDALNPADNFFNSTISEFGAAVTDRSPANANLLGFDIDQLDASGMLGNGDRSATITLDTTPDTGETFYPGVITFATDLYAPRLTATKTAVDVNGGTVQAGDDIRYTIDVSNDGLDTAEDVRIADAVPPGTAFVGGSLSVGGAAQSDQADTDRAEFSAGVAQFRVGTASSGTTGGSIPVGGTATVRYDVTADGTDLSAATLRNVATVSATGAGTGVKLRAPSNETLQTLPARPTADLAVTATVAPPVVQGSGAPVYTFTVTNTGPDPATGVALAGAFPAGVTIGASTPSTGSSSAGSCGPSGQTLTCPVGSLAVGATFSVEVNATAATGTAHHAVTTATATAGTDDPYTSNDSATVALIRNTAPAAVADAATVAAGASVNIVVRANDTDPDGDTLRVLGIATPPAGGHAVVNADGTVRYTAGATPGADPFTYTVEDGNGGTATATVTVAVTAGAPPAANAAPSATDDTVTLLAADASKTFDVRANDTDADADPLAVLAAATPAHGQVVLTPAGLLSYTPAAGYRGTDSFQYTVGDGRGGYDTATVHLTVADHRPAAVADELATPLDTALDVAVLANDTDPDTADTLTVGAFDPTSARGGTVTNSAGVLRYTPAAGFNGVDTFAYTVDDGNGGTAVGTVTVHVGPDRRPEPQRDAANTPTGTPVTIAVLANDGDPDGEALSVEAVTPGAYGSVVRNGDGSVTYSPAGGFSGVDSFTYAVSDHRGGLRAAAVAVTVFNAAPVGVADTLSTPAGTVAVLPVLGNDTDPNGDALRVTAATGALHGTLEVTAGGAVSYMPAAGYRGADAFTYTLSDGNGATGSATVALTVTNRAPVAVGDTASTPTGTATTVPVGGNDTDPDGDTLTVSAVGTPGHGTAVLNGDGTVTYTPAAGFAGVDTFGYTVTDAFGTPASSTGTVTISVGSLTSAAIQTAPVLATTLAINAPAGGGSQTINLLDNVTDADGDPLTVLGVTQPQHGTVVLNGDSTATYTPATGYAGRDAFTYTVTDGTSSVTGSVQVVVGAALGAAAGAAGSLPTTGPAAVPHALVGVAVALIGWLLWLAPAAVLATVSGAHRPGSRASGRTRRRPRRTP